MEVVTVVSVKSEAIEVQRRWDGARFDIAVAALHSPQWRFLRAAPSRNSGDG
jgi:hypothetical protein